jgi:hypothetical protein
MDDDKDLIEKTIEAVKNIATSVTAAAKHAVEPEPVKSGGGQVVFMPMAGDGFADPLMSPMPMVPVVIAKKKRKAKQGPAMSPPKAKAKRENKSAKKAAKMSAKRAKSPKRKAFAKKTAKNIAKKKKAKR